MKILISAYACLPNKGSEDGVGWNWVIETIRAGGDVTVITQEKNREIIESEMQNISGSVDFIYYQLPLFVQWSNIGRLWPMKKGLYMFWHLWHYPYHFFWQWGAYRKIKNIKEKNFDVIHHVTFATLRRSSFMGFVKNAKFIFGPVGGGERAPVRLRSSFGVSNFFFDGIRDMSILMAKMNPWLWMTCANADKIYATTNESKSLVLRWYRHKAEVKSQLGISQDIILKEKPNLPAPSNKIRFLYVGRFIYWKGMVFGLKAFAKLAEKVDDVSLTMVGDGPEKINWERLSCDLGIQDKVEWVSWTDRDRLWELYDNHHIFLFPSLHDSGGMVVLEALARGLPVVCLDLGGPAVLVDETCGVKVNTRGVGVNRVVTSLHEEMQSLVQNPVRFKSLSEGALMRSRKFLWSSIASDIHH